MRAVLVALCALLACGSLAGAASAHKDKAAKAAKAAIDKAAGKSGKDKSSEPAIRYVECRADDDSAPSVFGLDEITKQVCDRGVQAGWFAPAEFDAKEIAWFDGPTRKAIYRTGKDKRYEHDELILVHIGRCRKVKTPEAAQLCKS
jgi:hypothetical protein